MKPGSLVQHSFHRLAGGMLLWLLMLAGQGRGQTFEVTYDLAKTPGTAPDAPAVIAHGKVMGEGLGRVVRAGDVNGDGLDDLIIASATASAGPGRANAGMVCIWFGGAGLTGTLDAAGVAGRVPDVTVLGARQGDGLSSGGALAVADVNGDGIGDLLLGAAGADGPEGGRNAAGEAYVIFGREHFPPVLDLLIQGEGGADVTIYGADELDGLSAGGALTAGDVNGDGIADLLLAALAADGPDETRPSAGEAYVIYGREDFPPTLDLRLQGEAGASVVIYGAEEGDFLGYDGALKAADVNADGVPDILLGAVGADGPENTRPAAGEAYIIFGRPGLPPVLDLLMSGPGGADTTFYGVRADDQLTSGGAIVTGDVNGDGIDDLIFGTAGGDGPENTRDGAGAAHVVLGRAFYPPVIDLAVQGPGGADVTIHGATAGDSLTSGGALAVADVNKDGMADIVLGAGLASGPQESRQSAGEAYIVLGRAVFPAVLDLAIEGEDGASVTIYGASGGDNLTLGGALLTADLNRDGHADLILGALLADGPGETRSNAGEAYVVFGRPAFPATLDLGIQGAGGADITFYGATANDQLTRERSMGIGDFDGDGAADLILGARDADGPGETRPGAGEATVFYGSGAPVIGPEITLHQPAGNPLADGGGRYFGAVLLNHIGTRMFTVINSGTEALTGLEILLGGVSAEDYSVDRAALPVELAPGGSGTFTVTFAPATLGLRAAALQILSNDADESPYDIRLTGIGAAPELSIEEPAGSSRPTGATRAYGDVATGYSKTLHFVLKNIGTADLEGIEPELTGADAARFSFPAPASTTLPPGQSMALPVTFTPGVLGEFSAELRVRTDVAPDAPFLIHLTGSGVPPAPELDLEQPAKTALENGGSRAWPAVSVSASGSLVFTLKNTGTAHLTGIAFSIEGENAGDFAPSVPVLPDMAPGTSAAFSVVFSPSTRGLREAVLSIASNDADENPFLVHLSGSGVQPELVVEQPFGTALSNGESRALPVTIQGQQDSLTFTVRNTGLDDLTGLVLTQTGAHPADFVLLSPAHPVLAPGETTIFSVIFEPKARGLRTTTLRLASNDADDNPFFIPLSGVCAAPVLSVEHPPGTALQAGVTVPFPTVLAGESAPAQTFLVRNTGDAPLTGLNATVSGTNKNDFVLTPPALTSLQPGQSTSLQIVFSPEFAGTKTASLTLAAPTPGAGSFSLGLSATALPLRPLYSTAPVSRLLVTGEPHTLEPAITGAQPMTHRWRKNGKDLKTTEPRITFKSVKTADAGIYSHFVNNTWGSLGSGDLWVAVATRAPSVLRVRTGAAFTLKCAVKAPPGAVPAYEWLYEGQPLQPGEGVTGLGTKTLKITGSKPEQSGVYTCRVTLATPVGPILGTHGDSQVFVVEPPRLLPFDLDDFWVSQPVEGLVVPCEKNPTRFAAAGLPPGVKLDPATGAFHGKPTAARFIKGVLSPYQVKITVSNIAGKDVSALIPWTIHPLPVGAAGVYHGIVERHESLNDGLGGACVITIAGTGAFSGKLSLGAQTLAFKGSLNVPEGGGDPGLDLPIPRKKPLPPLRLAATLDLAAGTVTTTEESDISLTAWRKAADTASQAGVINAALIPPESVFDDATTYPQGAGYACVKVSPKGAAAWTGRLADGSAFTYAGVAGEGGEMPLHVLLMGKTGSLQGWHLLTPGALDSEALDWFIAPPAKPRTKGAYRQGIPLHPLTLAGAPHVPPGARAFTLQLEGGGLPESMGAEVEITAALKAQVDAGALALQITSFKAATGHWSGHFTFEGRKAALHGLLIARPDGGCGHFLLPEAPGPGQKAAAMPPWSGRAVLLP